MKKEIIELNIIKQYHDYVKRNHRKPNYVELNVNMATKFQGAFFQFPVREKKKIIMNYFERQVQFIYVKLRYVLNGKLKQPKVRYSKEMI